jgi:hypothetical protein
MNVIGNIGKQSKKSDKNSENFSGYFCFATKPRWTSPETKKNQSISI